MILEELHDVKPYGGGAFHITGHLAGELIGPEI